MIKKQKTAKNEGQKLQVAAQDKPISKGKTTFFVVLLVIILITAIALMINQKMKPRPMANNPMAQTNSQPAQEKGKPMEKADIVALINRVSNLITIKTDEEPTVATVQDADSLRKSNPVFYKDAENGDRLLVWSDKAVLYSTKLDKLLSVMPIVGSQQNIGINQATTTTSGTQATSTASTIQSEKATVEVRNGTLTVGLAKTAANLLKAKDLNVTMISDANSKDFAKTVIVKLTDKDMPATLAAIQEATKAQVAQLTADQTKGYKGDFVVIVGQDFVK